ncbi:uncharacterized protein FIBRA_04286 [Fibroporia radiculosa]|uniref:Uncharacterized protein n=1 Tax=Fibroporia radiculosa TaxID=599839 RepID=J4IA32_9APHY|nr:uncharacterized protein FIBRA_04286 [Fibroporia radiculosa]CCM02206.1 predicted protein [Fibroporia radiculosa]
MSKRRRHFSPPPAVNVWAGSAHSSDDESIDRDEEMVRARHMKPERRWQKDAGQYKDANAFLHDLHVEQRHRILLSSSTPYASQSQVFQSQRHPYPSKTIRDHTPISFSSTQHSRHMNFPRASASFVPEAPGAETEAETRDVMQRYEDTNRALGSIVLSRRLTICAAAEPREE